MADTEESKISDEEVLKILQKEHAEMYRLLPEPMMKSMEPMMVRLWRISKMKVMAPSVVFMKGEKETYLYDPVLSVDHNLQYLNAVMDAFLVVLFR